MQGSEATRLGPWEAPAALGAGTLVLGRPSRPPLPWLTPPDRRGGAAAHLRCQLWLVALLL